ncbi:MAG: hypothetical protein PHO15_09040 [Eubacteriales bacterium]|nr:hypothetical protein [Eubacteriales bacterium]
MKFIGKPGLHVIDHDTGMTIGIFDKKGCLDVKDGRYVARMQKRFEAAGKPEENVLKKTKKPDKKRMTGV